MYNAVRDLGSRNVRDLKKTRLGLIFLLSAGGAYTLGILGSIVSCIPLLMNLAALGLGITAIVFLLMGSRPYGSSQKLLSIGSLVLVGIAILIRIFVVIMMISVIFMSFAGVLDETTSGANFADMMEGLKPYIYILVVPYLMMAVGLVLPALKITPTWGKVIAGVFGFMVIVGLAVMVIVQVQNIDSLIEDIEREEEYDPEEMDEVQQKRTFNAWASQLLLGSVHLLALAAILGALLECSKRIKEEQSRQNRPLDLYNPTNSFYN
ncbi:MAG: hypothetical protein ACMUIE_06405 [Thermoplasmatota archaeon]